MHRLLLWGGAGLGVAVLLAYCAEEAPGPRDDRCIPFVELVSTAELARELGRPESWVISNHRINLWRQPQDADRGGVLGRLLPGSRAPILDRSGEYYLVKSPLDGSRGWVHRIQVDREVVADSQTNELCADPGAGESVVK
jgi:hypothetical protein